MLVKFYIDKKLHVTTIPGPSSIISSLQVSGMAIDSFKFLGFFPKSKSKFEQFIENLRNEYQTSIFFVSTHRLIFCLEGLQKKLNERKITVCKELTKLNEKIFRGYAKEILEEIKKNKENALGEFVVLIEGASEKSKNLEKIKEPRHANATNTTDFYILRKQFFEAEKNFCAKKQKCFRKR